MPHVQYEVHGCSVSITFSEVDNPELKRNLLWYLTQCYEQRVMNHAEEIETGEA
jgi:hypothetical protein